MCEYSTEIWTGEFFNINIKMNMKITQQKLIVYLSLIGWVFLSVFSIAKFLREITEIDDFKTVLGGIGLITLVINIILLIIVITLLISMIYNNEIKLFKPFEITLFKKKKPTANELEIIRLAKMIIEEEDPETVDKLVNMVKNL